MNLGASEYSIGNARGSDKYIHGLLRRARKEKVSPAILVRDLAQKPSQNLFSSRPSTRSLESLAARFNRK